ncbi:MAG TPA: DNA primase small subunit domain-containing protein [Candidatus Paceibacterota bacterium]|nr:DNA primase small subunit domain-containing protein [Candidatus Paceibacterota bacterium]
MEQKEERIRAITNSYYSRKDVLNAIFNFSNNREISPRYFEGFGKRPDSFQYPSDITSMVKRGATSFHCSQEIWRDPLKISTDLTPDKLNELRIGWDLVIDIDCKWLEYSKKAAIAIIKSLEFSGVTNIMVKFSGSKGFHIIIPWKSFPEEIEGTLTKNMFPEWPRAILGYLKEISRPILEKLIKETDSDFLKIQGFTGIKCERCSNIAQENYLITLMCESCYPKYIETFKSFNREYKSKKCPNCNKVMKEIKVEKFYFCSNCKIDSLKNSKDFNETILSTDIYKILGLDLQLVSSRHLFRMPYSLHEKTSLVSLPIDKSKLKEFQITDANPLYIQVNETFFTEPKKNEAKNLLINSIDWYKNNIKDEVVFDSIKNNNLSEETKKNFELIKLNEKCLITDNFPPVIQKILLGMEDGRKRSLFILLNFFRSLGITMQDIEGKINDWNKLNKPPLKQGYIKSQLIWHSKQKSVLPPNFDNPIYKELGVYEIDYLSQKTKNPVSYVIRKSNVLKNETDKKINKKNKFKKKS